MGEKEQLDLIQQSLCEFIIRTTKENAPGFAVQVLPEAVKSYIELLRSRF